MVSKDKVVDHSIKGELEIQVDEALSRYTLCRLLEDLPLPMTHRIVELRVDEVSTYNSETRQSDKNGKWVLNIKWEVKRA